MFSFINHFHTCPWCTFRLKESLSSISPPSLCLVGRIVFQFSSPAHFYGWNKSPVEFICRWIESCLTTSLQFMLRLNFGPLQLFWILQVGDIDDEESVFYAFWVMFSSAEKTCSMNEESNASTSITLAIPLRFCSTASDNLFIWEACLFLKYQSLSPHQVEISSVNPRQRSLLWLNISNLTWAHFVTCVCLLICEAYCDPRSELKL